jgi:HEAT repeat protein
VARCPYCGADISAYDQKNFDDKLINSLGHPVRETVGMAVWILGERKTVGAVAPLVRLFEMTDNPFLQRAILDALDKIGTEDALNFIMESIEHHISMVRRRAWEIMEVRKIQKKGE